MLRKFLAEIKNSYPEPKNQVVGKMLICVGRAEKVQVEAMVKILLPGCKPKNNDSADALAMAITRCHYRTPY